MARTTFRLVEVHLLAGTNRRVPRALERFRPMRASTIRISATRFENDDGGATMPHSFLNIKALTHAATSNIRRSRRLR